MEDDDGVGALRRRDGSRIEDVRYAFEVWHQVAQGFHGPFRCEGRVAELSPAELEAALGEDLLLEMADGRFLPLRLARDATFVGHGEPRAADPWVDAH